MERLFLGIAALVFSVHVSACTCSFSPLDTEKVLNAERIFIFQLRSAAVERGSSIGLNKGMVVGKIEHVETIHGGKTPIRTIRFSTYHCCGSRLDVGSHFIAFTSGNGKVLHGNNGNLIEVGKLHDSAGIREKILEIRLGKKQLSEVFSRDVHDRIEQSPVLPPCPDHGTGTERVSKAIRRD